MEHAHDLSDPVQPWRRATIAVSVVATLELVALATVALVVFGNPLSARLRESAAAASTPRVRTALPPPATQAKLARSDTSVMVLNGTGVAGAAHAAANKVSARGYRLGEIGNAAAETSRTLVMYRPGYEAEGRRLARDLRVRLVRPLDGMRPAQLLGSHLVLIIGR